MFLTTGSVGQSYEIKGIVTATIKRTIKADEIDQVDKYDELYEKIQELLTKKAKILEAQGIINVTFVPEIVRVAVGPKYMLLHGYGTAISFPKK